jgi:cytochrome o ubiquinol oxidase subunit 1
VPLQIGARDVSFPFLNNFSFWMTTGGAVLVMISLFLGEFSTSGWLACPIWGTRAAARVWTTTSGPAGRRCGHDLVGYQPDRDHHQDARPGMNLMKMPVFTWTALCTNALIVASFPVLTAALVLMSLDRYVGTNFFTNDWAATP